jgi:hypothetical protein
MIIFLLRDYRRVTKTVGSLLTCTILLINLVSKKKTSWFQGATIPYHHLAFNQEARPANEDKNVELICVRSINKSDNSSDSL